MNKQDAARVALEYVESRRDDKLQLQILEEHTIRKPYGWIFFYQSKDYFSKPITHLLCGNGPILVLDDGKIVQLPTAIPVDEAIRRYEAGLPLLPRPTKSTT
jgi:hypothetical protein